MEFKDKFNFGSAKNLNPRKTRELQKGKKYIMKKNIPGFQILTPK